MESTARLNRQAGRIAFKLIDTPMHCERCEELAEEIRQLRAELAGSSVDYLKFCDQYGMTPFEARVFSVLNTHVGEWVSQKVLMNINPDGKRVDYPDRMNTLKTRICHIRRKTRGKFNILCCWGEAYKLEPINNDTSHVSIASEQAAQSQA